MIRAVYFDLDNTIYDYNRADHAAITALKDYAVQNAGLSPDMFHTFLTRSQSRITEHLGKDQSAIHNRLIRFQYMLELAMQNGAEFPGGYLSEAMKMYHVYWDTFLENSEPKDGIKDFLSTLHQEGIPVGIATNMTAYMQLKKLERLELTRYIDRLVTSEEAGAEKPSASFFQYCIDKAECPPEQILFFGDSMKHDILGAAASGMQAAWYHPGDPGEYARVPLKETALQNSSKESSSDFLIPVVSSWQDCLNGTQVKWEKFCRI